LIAVLETKCGPLWISGSEEVVDIVSWKPIEGMNHSGELDWVLRALDDYFQGKLTRFPGSLLFMGVGTMWVRKPQSASPFVNSQKILAAIEQIPYGKTIAYSEVASAIGKPGAARAVGAVCRSNPIPILIPCHRVVGQTSLGGYTPGIHLKQFLLRLEGCSI
jgi:methylated-DNA-[protein]-cysteine S-methyltransferase